MDYSYPKKFVFEDSFKEELISTSNNLWLTTRGFCPLIPLTYQNSLVISLYTESGDFLSYQLRNLSTDDITEKYKLINPVYETYVKTDDKEITGDKVFCEGTIDCVLLRENNINAFTTLGLKKGRLSRLIRELHETFIFIPDNDLAGRTAIRQLKRDAIIIHIPAGSKDINDLYKSNLNQFNLFIEKLKILTQKEV
jgi:hypothetical protein